MRTRNERRAPDRHMVATRLLKRIAVAALVLSAGLWAVPRLLVEAGVLGPGAAEAVQSAANGVSLAKTYGAGAATPPLQAAERELEVARRLAAQGDGRGARQAAERASQHAMAAQKSALVARAAARERAQDVYDELDRQINDLEKLYSAVAPGLDKETVSGLLSRMKETRVAAGAVFLAYEQERYAILFEKEGAARAAIAQAKGELERARKP